MTQGQAILMVLAFAFALSIVVSVCVFVTAMVYEIKDRLRRRARPGLIEIRPDSIDHLDWTVR